MSQPPPSAPAGATGAVGKIRSPGIVLLLMIVTLGIYSFVWWYKSFQEMKDYSGEGLGGLVGLLLAFCYVSYFMLPAEVGNLYARDGKEKPVTGVTGLWNLLPLVGTLIWLWKTQNALSEFWASKGATK